MSIYASHFLLCFLQKRYTFWLICIAVLTYYHKRSCENVPRFLTLSAGFLNKLDRCKFTDTYVGIEDKIKDE